MKNYSSNRAQKGKTAYRTPSLYKANKSMAMANMRGRARNHIVILSASEKSALMGGRSFGRHALPQDDSD